MFSGSDALTEYRFNTKVAKHMFCKHCGVQAYYVPRSNPDGVAVTLACIPDTEVSLLFWCQPVYSCDSWIRMKLWSTMAKTGKVHFKLPIFLSTVLHSVVRCFVWNIIGAHSTISSTMHSKWTIV